MRSPITTHILDTSKGRPAKGVKVLLEVLIAPLSSPETGKTRPAVETQTWQTLGTGETDADGRLSTLLAPDHKLTKGTYRLSFDTGSYQAGFYPVVSISFEVANPDEHYHVPLLLNPYGYSTYRGS